MTTVEFLLNSLLLVGSIALGILGAGVALVIVFLGLFTGDCIAARYQGRRLVHYCQLYLLDDIIRAALDTNYQPRKEN
ncbi:hypothetical protein [Streptomyces sp. NPDC020377]|uniref:hypothetical protein n=1 Tax=Streptomyces sp. NPDC020377 TaxID=3365070 RepID=UPI00378D690B